MDIKASSFIFIFLICFVAAKRLIGKQTKFQDDVQALIETAGYESEVHQVETQDGYKLKVHRIIPKMKSGVPRLGPVFFMHGMLATAADYLMTGPEIGLPFLLSDNGYDVWLGNSRGTDHCLRHKTLKPDSNEFWRFSFHEIGLYDLPVMIDYMLSLTNSSKVFYVGHSQGSTSLLVLLSSRPEYNKKIIQAHLMAPAAFMKYFPHPLFKLFANELQANINRAGSYDFFATSKLLTKIGTWSMFFCQQNSPATSLCESGIIFLCGQNKGELELDLRILPTHLQHIAHAISLKQLNHYFQLHSSGKFCQYDYQEKNQKVYNSSEPPDYKLENVIVPIYMYSAGCDALVAERDVEHLKEVLKNVRNNRNVKNFNHCDFNYGKNARTILYYDMLQAINSHQETD